MKTIKTILLMAGIFVSSCMLAKNTEDNSKNPSFSEEYNSGYTNKSEVVKSYAQFNRFRLALDAGFGYRLTSSYEGVSEAYEDHGNQLRKGFTIDSEGTYFFKKSLGIGFQMNRFSSSNVSDNAIDITTDGYTMSTSLDETVTTTFIGPTFTARFYNKKQNGCYLVSTSLGYLRHKGNTKMFGYHQESIGDTFGFSISGGYDLNMSDNIALGLKVSLISGKIDEYEVTDDTNSSVTTIAADENLARIQLSIGIRLNL